MANDHANVRPIRTGVKRVDWSITGHTGWYTLTTCHKCDGVGGKSVMGCWSCFSGHTTSTLHMLLLALFTPLLPLPHILLPSRDERN